MKDVWLKEIKEDKAMQAVPMILVATKADLFQSMDEHEQFEVSDKKVLPHSTEKVRELSEQEGFKKYFETSALLGDNLKPLFDEVIGIGMRNKRKSNHNSPNGGDGKKKKQKDGGGGSDKDKDKNCGMF